MNPRAAGALALLVLLTGMTRAETRIIHDFDHLDLSKEWVAQGPVSLERKAGPPHAGATSDAPAGKAVHVVARGQAAIATRPVTGITPWPSVRRVGVWIYRDPPAHDPDILELRLHGRAPRSRFWRKLRVDHAGWKRYDIALPFMRWSEGRIPRWEAVDRLGFLVRDPVDLWIDSVSVDIGGPTSGAALTLDDLAAVAFPGIPPEELVRFVTPAVRILSAGPVAEVEEVGRHLVQVAATMSADTGALAKAEGPGTLVILDDAERLRECVARLAEQYHAHVDPPASDGFTLQGIAMGSWTPRRGIRPTFTHEFAHSFSEHRLELPNRGEWLHEAIASIYQQRFHPQESFGKIVRRGLAGELETLSLAELSDGRMIPKRSYWQALILLDMLQRSPRYAAAFPTLIEAFREAGSTALAPHLELLGTDAATLEADWKAWAAERHAR